MLSSDRPPFRPQLTSICMQEGRRQYMSVVVVDLAGLGSTHFKSKTLDWFKRYTAVFQNFYPETMLRTYVINAPMIFTVRRNSTHPQPSTPPPTHLHPHIRTDTDGHAVWPAQPPLLSPRLPLPLCRIQWTIPSYPSLPPPPNPSPPQGLWKAIRIFLHPTTAAKISVSSWGHEKIFHRDGIQLFGSTHTDSMVPWREVVRRLDAGHDRQTLAAGYLPSKDATALQELHITDAMDV